MTGNFNSYSSFQLKDDLQTYSLFVVLDDEPYQKFELYVTDSKRISWYRLHAVTFYLQDEAEDDDPLLKDSEKDPIFENVDV